MESSIKSKIWDTEWFMNLSCRCKCIILLVLSKCDEKGVWEWNKKLIEFCIGEEIKEKDSKQLAEHLEKLGDGKVRLKNFESIKDEYLICPKPAKKKREKKTVDESLNSEYGVIVEKYNTICKSYPRVRGLSGTRIEKIRLRLKEMGNAEVFEEVFREMEASDFMKGKNDRGWKASLDWLIINDNNWVKVVEGKYRNKDAEYKVDPNSQEYKRARSQVDFCLQNNQTWAFSLENCKILGLDPNEFPNLRENKPTVEDVNHEVIQ